MAPLRLLDLPPEIRNQIWQYVVVAWELYNVSYRLPALTQVSRQVRSESRGYFFADNRFRINLGLYSDSKLTNCYRLFSWLAAMGPEARAQIHSISIMFYWDVFVLPHAPGPLDIPMERFVFQMIAWHPLTRGLRRSAFTFHPLTGCPQSPFQRRVRWVGKMFHLDYALGQVVDRGVVRRRCLATLAWVMGPTALTRRPWLRWACKSIIDSENNMKAAKAHAQVAIKTLREDPRAAVDAVWKGLKKELKARWVLLTKTACLVLLLLLMWLLFGTWITTSSALIMFGYCGMMFTRSG